MKIVDYIKDTKAEMKHVKWPSKQEAVKYTLLVIGISIVTSLVLGLFDYLFGWGLSEAVDKVLNN